MEVSDLALQLYSAHLSPEQIFHLQFRWKMPYGRRFYFCCPSRKKPSWLSVLPLAALPAPDAGLRKTISDGSTNLHPQEDTSYSYIVAPEGYHLE